MMNFFTAIVLAFLLPFTQFIKIAIRYELGIDDFSISCRFGYNPAKHPHHHGSIAFLDFCILTTTTKSNLCKPNQYHSPVWQTWSIERHFHPFTGGHLSLSRFAQSLLSCDEKAGEHHPDCRVWIPVNQKEVFTQSTFYQFPRGKLVYILMRTMRRLI